MEDLINILLDHFAKLDFIKKLPLNDGGNIFFGEELYQNQETLSITLGGIDDFVQQNGNYEERHTIQLTLTWYGNLNYLDTFKKAKQIQEHLRNVKYMRELDNRIASMEIGFMEYSDKIEDRYVFSLDFTILWTDVL